MWYAFQMDDGCVGSARTKRELLDVLGVDGGVYRTHRIAAGIYEYIEKDGSPDRVLCCYTIYDTRELAVSCGWGDALKEYDRRQKHMDTYTATSEFDCPASGLPLTAYWNREAGKLWFDLTDYDGRFKRADSDQVGAALEWCDCHDTVNVWTIAEADAYMLQIGVAGSQFEINTGVIS